MNNIIIISRQYGSMGSDIARIISDHYSIPIYSQEDIIAKTEGVHVKKEMIDDIGTKPNNSFLYSLAMDMYSMEYTDNPMQSVPTDHKKFIVQCNKIIELAKEQPAVFVGRAADYALSEINNKINIYFYADLETRIQRISDIRNIDKIQAKKEVIKIDKERSKYYNYFTNKKWGDPISYDLCINTTNITIEKCAEMVISMINEKEK